MVRERRREVRHRRHGPVRRRERFPDDQRLQQLRRAADVSGGYFAQPTNIGSHTRTVFAVVPEVGLNVGYQITPWMSVFGGYTFLYMNNVVRAPQQVNRNINPLGGPRSRAIRPRRSPGPAQPSFKFDSSEFWAQGLTVGLAFRF